MELRIRQRLFSWFDSYEVYGEDGSVAYTVKGELALGHQLRIYDCSDRPLGLVKQVVLSFLPAFQLSQDGQYIGTLHRKMTLFHTVYEIEELGWRAEGDFPSWNYQLTDAEGRTTAMVSKKLLNLTDTYVLDIPDPRDALLVLMIVIAIDAALCTAESAS